MARQKHANNGHWGHNLTKLKLMDCIYSPKLDRSITNTILACPQYKNFGSMQLHTLMYPITRCNPFELLIANYLSLPKGKNGFHNVLLILDMYSQYTWGFKFKTHGMARTTVDRLKSITHNFHAPETFMMDGGSHFDNRDVHTTRSRT
jgi:hypothetical protein